MKRLLIFVHYNQYNNLSTYVLNLLEEVSHLYEKIIFVSNSVLSNQHILLLNKLCKKVIQRENIGFDFGAWRDALLEEKWENLEEYDSITLMNDTCFGPLFNLENVYKAMEEKDVDFWGISNHKRTDSGMPGTNESVPEHIKSYF